MQFNITEEEINNLIKELEIDLEEASKDGKVWGYKDEFEHISNRYVKISPRLGSILYGDEVITAFHVTSIENIERIKSLQSTRKQGISAFTYMGKEKLRSMGGIETSGGIIFELKGKPLIIGTRDIMSVTDQRLTRWVPNSYVIPSELHNEFNETISSFKNNNQYPYTGENPTEDQGIYKLRYVALYNRSIDLFIEKHKEQIKKFLQTDMGSSYDEILIHNFEVNDVLLTVDKAKSGGKYSFLIEFNELRRITNYRELNTDELIRFKDHRRRFNEIKLELESFIKGNLTFTEDPNVSLTWVKERGGMFDREEYRNKLKELTENKTIKKMRKKIKISESQLKTIMERKHTYVGDTNEEEKFDIDQLEDKDKEKIDVKEPEEVKEGDFGMDSETPETEVDEMMNESIKLIKANFKRFL
jgi:hypothetical protein